MKTWAWLLACLALLAVLGFWWRAGHDARDLDSTSQARSDGRETSISRSVPSPETDAALDGSPTSAVLTEEAEPQRVALATPVAATAPPAPSPVAWVRVLAQDPAGHPLPGVKVMLDLDQGLSSIPGAGSHSEAGSTAVGPQGWNALAITGADGMVEFRVDDPRRWSAPGRLSLSGIKTTGSATLAVPLVSETVVVTMQACACVEASVLDARGLPLEGAFVDLRRSRLAGQLDLQQPFGAFQRTNASGLAVFDELLEGEYEFSCRDTVTGRTASEVVETRLGQRRFVQLRFPADPAKGVAVAGIVVDESENPLPKIQVRLRVDGAPVVAVLSDAGGAFSHSAAPGSEVEIQIGGGLWDDDFEPSSQRVPFGTQDVRLRRTRHVEWMSVEFVCLDADTNQPVDWKSLSGKRYRASAPSDEASFRIVAKGRATLMFKERDDWHVVVGGLEYAEEDVALADAMTSGPDGKLVVIRLRRRSD